MKHFDVRLIVDNTEWESRLEELARRCESLNGWTEQDLIQFAVNAMTMYHVWLPFLEDKIIELEHEKKNKPFGNRIINAKK